MNSTIRRLGLAGAMVVSLMALAVGPAFADASVDSPGKVQSDTTQLNYTGQGAAGGAFNDEECGDNADFGSGNDLHGATPDNYILWLFNTDGGDTNGDAVLHVNGNTYSEADMHQVVTPAFDLSTIDAFMSFTVASTGSGDWTLVISHGCGGGEEDQPPPDGHIGGPCADPAYYGVFDNTAPSVAIKFRFTWWNTHGYNVVKKVVPAGMIYTTFQHWAKPNTPVKVGYKDPNTGVWHNLDTVISVHGSFDPCDVKTGFSSPPQ